MKLKGGLITLIPMTNSLWVTLHILWRITSPLPMTNSEWVTLDVLWTAASSHLFLWPTGSVWHFTFCERQSHHILSYQQGVSNSTHSAKGSLITPFLITNRKWVASHILQKAVSLHLFLWPTACECQYCACCRTVSNFIFSYGQQFVGNFISNVVKGSLITSFPMTNSLWTTILHILERQ